MDKIKAVGYTTVIFMILFFLTFGYYFGEFLYGVSGNSQLGDPAIRYLVYVFYSVCSFGCFVVVFYVAVFLIAIIVDYINSQWKKGVNDDI